MSKQPIKSKNFIRDYFILILVVIYFARFIFPQGIYSFTLTALFYYLTVYIVVGGLAIAGVSGVVGVIKSQVNKTTVSQNIKHLSSLQLLG